MVGIYYFIVDKNKFGKKKWPESVKVGLKKSSSVQALQLNLGILVRYLDMDIKGKKTRRGGMLPLILWNLKGFG